MNPPPQTSSFVQVPHSSQQKVKVVAGYALQQKLGSGSFAVVYKGVRLQQANNPADTVAIKAITRTSEKLTKKVLQNLEVEISIMRTYRHRNIVCLYDVQKTERHFYLILEYCGGGDVQRLIRSRKTGRLSEGLTRRLMRDLSAGLKFLWGQSLIHRDIKPQNLLLTGPLPNDEMYDPEKSDDLDEQRRQLNYPSGDFSLKIADFGFARHLQTASLAETLCGSPLYMAPEILQHHRYDAKADIWSVGTVLFEMIAGRPPFHGENHIDLLRNIQRKAVRLPADVRVSKECVNLLRLLLNRNPLSRAGFQEFFEACDAFVALGCQGTVTVDEGTCRRPSDIVPITEAPFSALDHGDSLMTVATNAPSQQTTATHAFGHMHVAPPPAGGPTIVPLPMGSMMPSNQATLTPLVASPPVTGGIPHYSGATTIPDSLTQELRPMPGSSRPALQSQMVELTQPSRRAEQQNSSTDENSFVMVEHTPAQQVPTPSMTPMIGFSNDAYRQSNAPGSLQASPPSSPGLYFKKPTAWTGRGDYMVVKPPKGMLSTSPGTGGALMGMLTGRTRLLSDPNSGKQIDSQITAATKMLAAAEDVGRRAISVAHLGDNRAYLAMRLVMINEGGSSLLSATPMDDIEEEADHESGAVTDDSSSTEIMASVRRRRSSSATDKSMADAKIEDEVEEMPFAVAAESPPLLSAGIPTRSSLSYNRGSSVASVRPAVKPTPAMIRGHFSDALACYVKGLKMLKSAISAAQRVSKDVDSLSAQRLSKDQLSQVHAIKKRCEVTPRWLGDQFKGVLERGDATNIEINKLPDSAEGFPNKSVEELIYNHALTFGRDGAVKQLLGQYEAARGCYRSAGLLAETLLMDPRVEGEDRKVLEGYVDGFAARITELDESMLQQSRMVTSSGTGSAAGSRRGSAVVGLIGQPLAIDPPTRNRMPS